jgi:DNA helicase II / ATP-dependent DNA helicase PcrA
VLDLSTLNAPQRAAVTASEGPKLVIAGAGSGKTRVIAHRIAWLIQGGVDPETILAVTFTNKAATEMRERVRGLCGRDGAKCHVATFHGFGLWFLREEHVAAGLPRWFSICDAGDQSTILKRCLRDVQMDSRRFDVRRLLTLISGRKNATGVAAARGGRGASASGGSAPRSVPDDDYETIATEVMPRYDQALRAQRSLDFDDLLVRPVSLLAGDRTLREKYRERFRHVLVDEYQDTNGLQVALLRQLCLGGHRPAPGAWAGRSLCAVGDDDQAIYGWRGAEIRNIQAFEKTFPGAEVVRLEQNYRSTGNILACANAVIARSALRRPKTLWTDAGAGEPVRVVALPDEHEEARFVAGEISRGLAAGRTAGDFAVLYRLNAQSQPIEEALREAGLSHRVKGGPAFFDRSEVRDVVAWLKVCAFPDDDVSIARISNSPPRGIGDVAMERLGTWAAERKMSVGAALERASAVPDIPRGAPERMAQFAEELERFRRRFTVGQLSEPARAMFDDLDFRAWLRQGAASPEAGTRRAEAVDSVLRSLEWHERREPKATLRSFLNRLALDSREEEPEDAEGVTLMTLHSAKGLEFPVVFLIGVEEDLLPVSGIQGEARDLEEERRLAYVGITRAREQLWVVRATGRVRRGRIEPRTPSRFLEDLPASAHVRHDPNSTASMEDAAARSTEVLQALRARLAGRR